MLSKATVRGMKNQVKRDRLLLARGRKAYWIIRKNVKNETDKTKRTKLVSDLLMCAEFIQEIKHVRGVTQDTLLNYKRRNNVRTSA